MLYRFQIELSDIDRGIYQTLDFRVIQHPSEVPAYLLTRVLAYALSYQENLEFSTSGLADPDTPALLALSPTGNNELWIEIGNTSARKLHKAGKVSKKVLVYTYKNPEILLKEILDEKVHRANEIEIFSFAPQFLDSLEKQLKKSNHWNLVHQQGQLDITYGDKTINGEVKTIRPSLE